LLLPAVNVIGSNSINGVLETAKELNAPVIIQFSNGGAQFNAGKGFLTKSKKLQLLDLLLEQSMFIQMAKLMVFL
jgi:fructose-bisphosphate aldolase class II